MTEIREEIAREIALFHDIDPDDGRAPPWPAELADRILAIPRLQEALEWIAAQRDAHFLGTGFVKITRVDPADVYLKPPEPDPPISTNTSK